MPYKDFREWVNTLEAKGRLHKIRKEVDWSLELGAVIRRTWDTYGDAAPSLMFENIKDYHTPSPNKFFVTSGSWSTIALTLGMPLVGDYPRGLVQEYRRRAKSPIKPVMVDSGPCKENITRADDVDLLKFPVPFWHERDGGRYIGTATSVITKDPETGWLNVGCYRMMVHGDRKSLGTPLFPGGQHWGLHYLKYIQRNEPMPVVIAMGNDPVLTGASMSTHPVQVSEFDVAGGLRGQPLELTKAETVDLPVPASSEIVIEGTIDPKQRKVEGPFGEFSGFYGDEPGERPIVNVSCVTHRDDPILEGVLEGYSGPQGISAVTHIANSSFARDELERAGVPGVVEVGIPISSSSARYVVAVKT